MELFSVLLVMAISNLLAMLVMLLHSRSMDKALDLIKIHSTVEVDAGDDFDDEGGGEEVVNPQDPGDNPRDGLEKLLMIK